MTRPLPSALWRLAKFGAAFVVFLALIGATCQGIMTARERRAFPYPGRLVDIGGYQLHIRCAGTGTPTVVFESPGGGLSAGWSRVQREVARATRACAYDRAGLGWSEAGAPSFDPGQVAPALATLLANADLQPPFVLVGHGLGNTFASLFAAHQPGRVQALVHIGDPRNRLEIEQELADLGPRAAWLARFGVLRASSQITRYAGDDGEFSAAPIRAFLNRPDHLTRAVQEIARLTRTDVLTETSAAASVIPIRLDAGGDPGANALTGDGATRVAEAIVRIVQELRSGPRR